MAPPDIRAGPVLVTGAGGFLGVNVVAALRRHGIPVRALVRRPPAGPQWQGLDGLEFIQGDVRDRSCLQTAVVGVQSVIHAAALTDLMPRPRRLAFQVNVEGTRVVCEAALAAGVRRLVLTSSLCTVAGGTAEEPATEDTPYNLGAIRSPYYESKRLAERVVRDFQARGLETITLCPAFIIGPRDGRPTSNKLLLFAARSPLPLLPPGGINVIDVREAALAHVRALWLGRPGERYLLAGPYVGYADLGRCVRAALGLPAGVGLVPKWIRGPGLLFLALLGGVLPRVPSGLSVPGFRYGFEAVHVSGTRGDAAFGLTHRPLAETVVDTLRWFRQTGLAPWLRGRPLPGDPVRPASPER
jgi:dihydroflavonol-4-reductase